MAAVWVFNVWGTSDLVYALYAGNAEKINPGHLGAAFFIPTFVVPGLLVTHVMIFRLLSKRTR
jgi:hypothetical protein